MTTVDTSAIPVAGRGGASASRRAAPYLLAFVGAAWLVVLFLVPLISGLLVSLMTGNPEQGYALTWNWAIYRDVIAGGNVPYLLFLGRALFYGATATVLTIVIGYPMAYFIAFRVSQRWKTPLLSLVMISFLVSFVLRINMWKFLLGNDGPVISALHALPFVPADFHILGTSAAVIGTMTYNDLAFMVLPIYVALERIDPSLHEAARDLYGHRRSVFLRVTLPLSRAGIFSGILLVFIDCAGDPVNSQIMGGTGTTVIGQAIQTAYLTNQQYNVAAALSTILMVALGIILFAYARVFGTDNIEDLV
ncbi:ABC transporter permease [Gryllotalpicola ginsengisoli]|uniref:ABC transporter permease n=1 Tax=Gryllotalpicola ginsengisoli TaxID=444608 RepID=UPI0003B3AD9D|nr:ABC transporter permease [Gryllotalpicola ginsengisoli]